MEFLILVFLCVYFAKASIFCAWKRIPNWKLCLLWVFVHLEDVDRVSERQRQRLNCIVIYIVSIGMSKSFKHDQQNFIATTRQHRNNKNQTPTSSLRNFKSELHWRQNLLRPVVALCCVFYCAVHVSLNRIHFVFQCFYKTFKSLMEWLSELSIVSKSPYCDSVILKSICDIHRRRRWLVYFSLNWNRIRGKRCTFAWPLFFFPRHFAWKMDENIKYRVNYLILNK